MIKIKKLFAKDFSSCYNLLQKNDKDLSYFKKLGWSLKQFNIQFLKKINFGIGIYYKGTLEGFIFGDLITIEKKLEYEILLIYVNIKKRNLGYATKLLKNISLQLNSKKLKKIHLEVAKNNIKALKLYKKNLFIKIGVRKNYYNFLYDKIDAVLLEKSIDAE